MCVIKIKTLTQVRRRYLSKGPPNAAILMFVCFGKKKLTKKFNNIKMYLQLLWNQYDVEI